MNEVIVASVAAIGAVIVALIERSHRRNRHDHQVVADKIEHIGKSLGQSIDRVERTAIRTETKLDTHIRDHATGVFSEE